MNGNNFFRYNTKDLCSEFLNTSRLNQDVKSHPVSGGFEFFFGLKQSIHGVKD